MVTIHQLEVILEVDGAEEVAFAKLFDKHVRRWQRARDDERARLAQVERDRRLYSEEDA